MSTQRIVLAGFMGSGKTTIGRLLAAKLDWNFADLDTEIESRFHASIPEIFAHHGESTFRAAELETVRDLVKQSRLVIALGGGAPGTAGIRELLAETKDTAVVHLHAPFELLYERCRAQALDPQATPRPLLTRREATERRYLERQPLFAQIAHCTVNATLPPQAVVDAIVSTVRP